MLDKQNLAAIRRRGGHYLVGTPRSKLKQFEAELLRLRTMWVKLSASFVERFMRVPGRTSLGILPET
jgi:hypothetical protein